MKLGTTLIQSFIQSRYNEHVMSLWTILEDCKAQMCPNHFLLLLHCNISSVYAGW